MNTLSSLSSPAPASSKFYKLCAQILLPSSRRHQSSYRRSRSRLNVKPDPTFLPSKTEVHDHIIYNPPPSMPNVYHTPAIFLPKTDKRRQIQASLAPPDSQLVKLPPPVVKPHEKRYHLTEKDVEEIRALRIEDPIKWSRTALAKKYDCAGVFVENVIAGLAPGKMAQQKAVTEVVKSRWGVKRRVAREDRDLRKERWFRDE